MEKEFEKIEKGKTVLIRDSKIGMVCSYREVKIEEIIQPEGTRKHIQYVVSTLHDNLTIISSDEIVSDLLLDKVIQDKVHYIDKIKHCDDFMIKIKSFSDVNTVEMIQDFQSLIRKHIPKIWIER